MEFFEIVMKKIWIICCNFSNLSEFLKKILINTLEINGNTKEYYGKCFERCLRNTYK